MMNNNVKENNNNFVNIVKFILSIFVIAGHTKLFNNFTSNIFTKTLATFMQVCVPFFFLSTGYSLAEKINFNNCKKIDLVKMKYVIAGIIKQYILWSIVYFPLALAEYFQTGNSFVYNVLSYIKGFFFKGEHYNSWMLWYLLSLIYALSFIYYCLKKKMKFKTVGLFCILLGSLSIVLKYYNLATFIPESSMIYSVLKHVIDDGRIFTGFLYISLGIIIQNIKFNNKVNLLMFIVSLIVSSNVFSIIRGIGILALSVSFFIICLSIKMPNKFDTICNYLKDLSTSNYYLHMYAFTIYYYIYYKEPTYTKDAFVYTTLLTLALGIIFLVFKKKRNDYILNRK